MMQAIMLEKQELIGLHEQLNQQFWGASGLRDEQSLESALARPLASFGGEDLYPTLLEKAAALVESLVKNHPFLEGNMRTAYVAMRLLLLENGRDLSATEEVRHELMLNIAICQLGHQEIVHWLYLYCPEYRKSGV